MQSHPEICAARPFTPLLRRILITFSLVGTLAFFLYVHMSLNHERETLLSELASQAEFTAATTQSFFDNIGYSLELATHEVKGKQDIEAHRSIFEKLLQRHPEISFITIFDARGHRLFTTFTDKSLITTNSATFSAILPKHSKDDFNLVLRSVNLATPYGIGRVEYGQLIRQWRIPVNYAARDSKGNIDYIIHAAIPVSRQTALWSNLGLLPNTRIGLYRDDGFLLARWEADWHGMNPEQFYGGDQAPQSPMENIVKNKRLKGYYEGYNSTNGDVRLGAYARVPRLPLTAYVSVPTTLAYQNWWHHNYALIISLIIGLLSFFGFSFILLNRERQHSSTLVSLAVTDPLTDLPNRNAAEHYLTQMIDNAENAQSTFAVLFLDLDQFKIINDNYGHSVGDQVLKLVAERLQSCLRSSDQLARLGGDEFLAIINCKFSEQARIAAVRLLEAMKASFIVADREFQLSMSIGISLYPRHGQTASDLLKQADIAMYSVKNANRNGYAFFMDNMLEKVEQDMSLRHQLEQAIRNNEFELFYQPKFASDKAIVGFEALIRWQHPERGLVMPGEFIPFAEESGMIIPLGEWVIRAACRQLSIWSDAGHQNICVSINVSVSQFEQPRFTQLIENILMDTGVHPSMLELEITESALASDIELMQKRLYTLSQMGIRIALDDFGTGYSSLSYLKQFPIHSLKIDRSFVKDISIDPNDAAIVSAIIAMSKALQMKVVAEGVETAEQLEYLQDKGCDEFQGYYLARPMNVQAINAMLTETVDGTSRA